MIDAEITEQECFGETPLGNPAKTRRAEAITESRLEDGVVVIDVKQTAKILRGFRSKHSLSRLNVHRGQKRILAGIDPDFPRVGPVTEGMSTISVSKSIPISTISYRSEFAA